MNTIEEGEITLARKRDALALAQLILDIYKDKNQEGAMLDSAEAE